MANDEHVAILKKGVDTWNAWRRENPRHPPGPQRGGLCEGSTRLSFLDISKVGFMAAKAADSIRPFPLRLVQLA